MRQNLYTTCAALALVFIAALASRFILFPSNVGLLGVIEPNHVVLGKTVLNKTTLEVYASYDYDCAVLGITVLTPDSEPRYLPLYGSTYRGLPPLKVDLHVSDDRDGLWVFVTWDGQPEELLEYFPLDNDGSPKLAPPDSSFSEPIPSSFGSYSNASRDRDPGSSIVLSVKHDGEKKSPQLNRGSRRSDH